MLGLISERVRHSWRGGGQRKNHRPCGRNTWRLRTNSHFSMALGSMEGWRGYHWLWLMLLHSVGFGGMWSGQVHRGSRVEASLGPIPCCLIEMGSGVLGFCFSVSPWALQIVQLVLLCCKLGPFHSKLHIQKRINPRATDAYGLMCVKCLGKCPGLEYVFYKHSR